MNTVKKLLKSYKIRPLKRLGQNFLIDEIATRKIIRAASLKPEDVVLEIGPGVGNLTQRLAQKVKKVVAVEKDPNLIEVLRKTVKNFSNTEIVQEDILKFKPLKHKLGDSGYKIVANLPFYLTAPLIRKFLEGKSRPKEMTLIIQKEVAKRIVAYPPKMNLLAVSVQFYAKPKIISFVPKKSFWPPPEVDGAIIKFKTKNEKRKINKDLFFKIVRAGFSHPRKQLINNFSKKLNIDRLKIMAWLLKNGVQPTQRAGTLRVEDWIKLTKSFKIKT